MSKPTPSIRVAVVSIASVLGVTAWLFGNPHVFSQDAKRKVAAVSSKAQPRSSYSGKIKLEQGVVTLPDGRKIVVPANMKSTGKTGGQQMSEESICEADEAVSEGVAEEVSKREQLQQVNPAALHGLVIKPAGAPQLRNPHNRSQFTGKAKVKNGFVVLPDGRQAAVPADVKAKWPGMAKGEDWPGSKFKSDEAMVIQEGTMEVSIVADEANEADEAAGSKPGTLQANPGALKGKVVQTAPVQQPAQAPAKPKTAQ